MTRARHATEVETEFMHTSDRIELETWRSILCGREGRAAGVLWKDLDEGAAFATPGVPHLMFNRAVGVSPRRMPEAISFLRGATESFFVHTREPEPTPGLARYPRSWVKLRWAVEERPMPVADAAAEGLTLRAAEAEDADALARVYCDAFDIPPSGLPFIRGLVGRDGWHVRVVTDGSELVAVGLLFVVGDHGCLAGGATRPSHRRRGIQRLLIDARLSLAARLGLSTVWSETGEEKPGEAQHSYRNMTRAGFVPVGVRHNDCPPGTTWPF